jgi:hypothetical protein
LGEQSAEKFSDFPVCPGVRALDSPTAFSNIVSTNLQVATPFTLITTGFTQQRFYDIKMTVLFLFRQNLKE